MHNATKPGTQLLAGIQYLRGIAAMMVVFHHARHEFGAAMTVTFGAMGVEIFFVISGLVMMYSTRAGMPGTSRTLTGRWSETLLFWIKRLLRVAPLYWLALLLAAANADHAQIASWTLLRDALFIPQWNREHPQEIWPTLIAGWSLNYEMFFYFLFGLSFLLGRWGIRAVCLMVCGLSALGLLFNFTSAVPRFYTDSVMLHFVAGILLYYLIEALRARPTLIPPRWMLAVMLVAGFAGLARTPAWGVEFWLPLASTLIVFSAVFLFDGVRLTTLRVLGDASYSIYLFHTLSFLLTRHIIAWSGLTVQTRWGVLSHFLVYMGIAAIAGVAVHFIVEKPLTEQAGRLVRRRRTVATAMAG